MAFDIIHYDLSQAYVIACKGVPGGRAGGGGGGGGGGPAPLF